MTTQSPLCFVLMPFGTKPDGAGGEIDFDAVYRELIAPAVEAAGLEPLRADEEQAGGIIHKPMFERLILCEYAVADLTGANANVYYELGLRHAVREWSTLCLFAEGRGRLPFDLAPLRALPYRLGADGCPSHANEDRDALAQRLRAARDAVADSPVYQLVEDYPHVQHEKTDVFRDRVRYCEELKGRLASARGGGLEAVKEVEVTLGEIAAAESGVVIDLFLSYRAVEGWAEMIELAGQMAPPLARTVMVREQRALALNRLGRGDEAERELLQLIEERGPSSETFGLLGRVYKDRWQAALERGHLLLAKGHLERAVDAYLKGFESDWRDAYPGVNAVTLMELKEPPDPRRTELLPVVLYAVERRIAAGRPDYWDHATRLELAVLVDDCGAAGRALADALAHVREAWEPKTTANNLTMIRQAREGRGEEAAWIGEIERTLLQAEPA